jgi:hypothetical protein
MSQRKTSFQNDKNEEVHTFEPKEKKSEVMRSTTNITNFQIFNDNSLMKNIRFCDTHKN